MSPLALAVLFVSLASAQPKADPFPAETKVRAAADVYVSAVCKDAKAQCEQARAVLEGYKSLLAEATACETGKCDVPRIGRIARDLMDQDERESALPRPAWSRTRPLLSVSALASARLSAAAGRLGKPLAASAPRWNPALEAPKVVEGVCLKDAAACAEFRALLDENKTLQPLVAACDARPCGFEESDALVVRADGVLSRYLTASGGILLETTPVFSLLNTTRNASVKNLAAALKTTMQQLGERTDGLAKKVDAAGADIAALPAEGTALMETYRQASLGADRLAHVLGHEQAGAPRAEVNAATARLSALRSRALAVMTARGLKDDKADALGAVPAAGGGGAVTAKPAGAAKTPPLSPAPAPTLLDARAVPVPPSGVLPAPPIVPGDPKWYAVLENMNSSDPVARADALRRLGRTTTVGNPGLYAATAYSQESPTGCAVATQVAVLKAHKLLPDGDPVAQEKALIDEGRRRGLFDNGTSPDYTGDLLVAHGMLVRRHTKAPWSQFTMALRTGHPLQVSVDARYLWNMTGRKLPHSILVSGAEVAKNDGRILGVYINDTGTNPPGAGKFVALDQFQKAYGGDFAEIQ